MYSIIILYLNVFFLFSYCENAVVTDPIEGNIDLIVGGDIEIGCKYENEPILEWRKNDDLLKRLYAIKQNVENDDKDDEDKDDHYEFESNKLKIKDGRRSIDEGAYKCIFKNNISATIHVSAKPLLEKMHPIGATTDGKSINVVEDSTLTLECTVNSSLTVVFDWFAIKNITKPDNEKHEIKDNIVNTGYKSSLTLKDLKREDRAYYGCQVTDQRGRVVTNIVLVRVKSKYAALWPFFGILGEVIILCTIIFIYEKRRQKPDFSDTTENTNESHSPLAQGSSKGQEIRQRK